MNTHEINAEATSQFLEDMESKALKLLKGIEFEDGHGASCVADAFRKALDLELCGCHYEVKEIEKL